MRVFVYYNLHRQLWSIKALDGPHKGLVVGHSHTVLLSGAEGRVSQRGRARVLAEKCKNVHAGIVGTLVHREVEGYFPGLQITYNPYRYTEFVHTDTETVYSGSQYAYMAHKKVYVL
jgi:hypothetical protein